MAAAAKSGDSKGLVISLVFCVILILILGTLAYFGYSGQEKLANDAKTAKQAEDAAKKNRDYYKGAWVLSKAYMGAKLAPDEQGILDSHHTNIVASASAAGDKETAELDKQAFDKIEKALGGWKDAKPANSFLNLKNELEGSLGQKQKDLDGLKTNTDALVGDLNKKLDASKAEKDQKERELKDANERANKELATKQDELNKLRRDYDDLSQKKKELEEKYAAEVAKLEADKKQQDKAMLGLQQNLERKERELAPHRVGADLTDKDQPKGKIVSMDATGRMPFINLGTADRLKTQLTFSVFGAGADGRPRGRKGTVEVIKVLSEHRSQVRVTALEDGNRNPLVPGDLLFNPAWSPSLRQHVAIAGIIDLTGEGRQQGPEIQMRQLNEFKRNLEDQGMIVDAYLDLKTLKMVGEVNRQTDYLIMGASPNVTGGAVKEGDPKAERYNKLSEEMAKMEKVAEANAVTKMPLRKFMQATGQPLPPGAEPESASPGYGPNGRSQPARPAGEKKEGNGEKKDSDK